MTKRARIKARNPDEFTRWVRLAEQRASVAATRLRSEGLRSPEGPVPLDRPAEALRR